MPEMDHQWGRASRTESSKVSLGLVAGQARTLKAALEHRIGVKVPPDARALCWLVEFAACLMDRCDIGTDGKKGADTQTAWKKVLHTDSGTWREDLAHTRQNSKRRKVGPAILSWRIRLNAELVIGSSGYHRARVGDQNTCGERQKIPESERWDADRILGMRAMPWSPDGSDNAFDNQVQMERPGEMVLRPPGEVLIENKVATTYFRRAHFDQWGLSEGCPGCRYLRTGQG